MNIKTLRKNYKELNTIERNSLFISALVRKDKSEENAVLSASPKTLWEIPDFTHLYGKVLSLQMIVIIEKANAWSNWIFFSEFVTEPTDEHARLALYYFFVYSDAWTAICEQLKLDADAVEKMLFPNSFLIMRLAVIDDAFRKLAFTEKQAKEFIGQYAATEGTLNMTLENKIKEFKDFLELSDK